MQAKVLKNGLKSRDFGLVGVHHGGGGPHCMDTLIHWLATNITRFEVKENERQTPDNFVQGMNSWTNIQGGEQSAELSCYYVGMTPPNKLYVYELHVYT